MLSEGWAKEDFEDVQSLNEYLDPDFAEDLEMNDSEPYQTSDSGTWETSSGCSSSGRIGPRERNLRQVVLLDDRIDYDVSSVWKESLVLSPQGAVCSSRVCKFLTVTTCSWSQAICISGCLPELRRRLRYKLCSRWRLARSTRCITNSERDSEVEVDVLAMRSNHELGIK